VAAPQAESTREPAQPEPADPATAGRIATTKPELSPIALATKPQEIAEALPPEAAPPVKSISGPSVALILAPLQDASALARRIRPASSALDIMRSDVAPHTTLPGPALPRALHSLEDAGLSKILVDRPKQVKAGSRGWMTGLLVAVVMLATFLGMELYNAPRSAASVTPAPEVAKVAKVVAKQEPGAVTPAADPPPAASSTAPSVPNSTAYPLSKSVEVTGLRFVGDRKPEVHYLVVNHSPGELGAVTVYVTIRVAASKPPLYHFSFRSPTLGPFESKEMVSSLDKLLHSPADWQGLHADVEIGQ
jgi:hypothetical protein